MGAPGRHEPQSEEAPPVLCLDGAPLAIETLLAAARGRLRVVLSDAPAFRARLESGRAVLERELEDGGDVYGVTTGVGASVGVRVPPEQRRGMAHNLLRFHGCGTGRILDAEAAATVLLTRLVSLARGCSGVRAGVLERMAALLQLRILPAIPEEGSVGASGDLTPLSYLAALLVGEREAWVDGELVPASDALRAARLEPLALEPRETLAVMNGTAVMTGLGCLAFERADRLARLSCAITAMASHAVAGNREHFAPEIFDLKPHPGTRRAAVWIRSGLDGAPPCEPARLQDRYSIRCAPHVVGVLLDVLAFARSLLEVELNGVDDNPIVDPDGGRLHHGGNFYGGHVAFAMDGLKAAVAGVADLLDRQLQLLCVPETNGGLPANLIRGVAHHGAKALQISTSALAAEAAKLTIPAASFSRSTESHNQDKVSMGTLAARDALRIVELAETVAAIGLLASCQALDLRGGEPPPGLAALRAAVRAEVAPLTADRRQDLDIERLLELHRGGALPLP